MVFLLRIDLLKEFVGHHLFMDGVTNVNEEGYASAGISRVGVGGIDQ
jgi:hypothetical protein